MIWVDRNLEHYLNQYWIILYNFLYSRWICIYPAYLNSNKTRQEGRLLPKEKCVSNPNYMEIRDVLISAGYQPIVEVRKKLLSKFRFINKRSPTIDVLWCQPIKLIQVVSTSEFHEYWWNDVEFIFFVPFI